MDTITISEVIKNYVTVAAICAGGIWTLWRFVLYRERHAKIEFNLDCRLIGQHNNEYIIELSAQIHNKGQIRQNVKKWSFDLLLFNDNNIIDETNKNINYQVFFPNKKISKREWIPNDWYGTFIDAGTIQNYTYLTSVPDDTKFISFYSRFIYPKTSDFHSAQKTFDIQTLINQRKGIGSV